MMTIITLIIVWTAMLRTSYSTCDYQDCGSKIVSTTNLYALCRSAREALRCIESTSKNNSYCSSVKISIDSEVAKTNQLIRSICDGECDLHTCMNHLSTSENQKERCRSPLDVIVCIETKLKSNQECFPIRKYVEPELDNSKKVVEEKCEGGAAWLTSSVMLCLGLSIMTYFLTALI